ncbi:MAG TPA: ABC transporter ATP-binding protein [Mycobacteriales bacterium]|nr:ABC transporter ATP-binding protein [Mycobacteriales bacterium]
MSEQILDIRGLSMSFKTGGGFFSRREAGRVKAVDDVDLAVYKGETLGLVGESGCGKTTLGRCILRVYQPTAGTIAYTRSDGSTVDLARLGRSELRPYRREIRTVFQDPNSSLNPRMTVEQIVGEPLRVNGLARGSELRDRVAETLRMCGLRSEYLRRYPHAFSGGERQRIGIARALVTNPRLVIADEAVSALDVSVRSQILNLLRDLQEQLDLTYIFVSHDLSVIQHLCDRVAVMYVGQLVEQAPTGDLYDRPRHPYTETLLSAVPKADPRLRRKGRRAVRGEVPDPAHPPAGCRFHPRCAYAQDDCSTDLPAPRPIGSERSARCHYAEDLDLRGVANTV